MADLDALGDIKNLIATGSAEDLKQLLGLLDPAQLKAVLEQLDAADFPVLLEKVDSSVLEALAEQISTPGELRQLLSLSGGNDSIIEQFVAKAGTDQMLDRVFSLFGSRFLPERAGGDTGIVEWHIKTLDGEKVYHLTISDGTAVGARGPAEKPRTTLTMSAPDLLRLCSGTLDGVTAFMNNKIKLAGDMMFGAKLPVAFDTAA